MTPVKHLAQSLARGKPPMSVNVFLIPFFFFYAGENDGLERLGDLPKVTQLVSGGGRIETLYKILPPHRLPPA